MKLFYEIQMKEDRKMRISGKKGILSLLLSLVLVLELILSSGQIVLASSENHQDVYTVKILNEQGESVPGVKVVYDLYTDATGSDKKQETVDAVTGDDGVLEIAAISEAQQADGEAYYKIVEASGEGYDSYNDTEMQTITSENVLTEREITLKKTVQKQKVTLTGLVTNVQNSQPLENVFVSDGDAGSTITGSDGTYSIELIEGNSYELTFSLDGYDEVSKTVTVAAPYVCDVQMNLSAVYDSTFRFNDATPKSVVYGENENKFINVASSEMADSKITYAIVKEKDLEGSDTNVDVADINSQTGEVTIKRSGMITVEATRAADITYAETKITYELSVVKADQTGFKFEEEVPQDKKYYPADGTYSNAAVGGQSTGKITYKVIEGTGIAEVNTDTGEVTFKKLGTVGIQATKAGDDKYNEITATYRITAIKKGQTRFKFDTSVPSDLHYGENNNKYLNEAKGGNGTGEITYSVEDGKDIVSVDPKTGEVSFIKAGQATIKATKTEDENSFYETATATYTLNIAKGTQSTLHFVRQNPEITWDANNTSFENALQGGSGNGELSYEIIEQKRLNGEKADTSVATIDKSTGKLTILSTGTVKVKGTKAGDESYKEATAEYELTIKKADQSIAFQETTKTVVYGTKEYTSVMANTGTGTGEITYSIEGENVLGVSMNPSTGVIRFADNKTGSIVIKATKAEDEKYNACEANYTLTVEYLDTPENPYELSGNQIDAESGWYTGNITISAPEGYQISTESSLNGTSWSDSFVYDIEGNHDLTVYLKKVDSDEITGGIAVQGLKIDKGDPYNLEISYEKDSLIQQIKNFFFGKDKVTVTIKATDDVSGIKAFKYKYDSDTLSLSSQGKDETEVLAEDEKVQKNEDGTVSYSFDIQPQFRGKVSFKAIDYAGRVSEKADTENTVVVDDKSPKVKVTYAPVGEETTLKAKVKCDTAEEITREDKETADEETRFIYDGAVKATIKTTEANFYTDDVIITVKKDGSEIWNGPVSSDKTIKDGDTTIAEFSDWTIDKENDTATCEIIMQADGDYEIGIDYTDSSSNDMNYSSDEYAEKNGTATYRSNIMTVDTTVPTVEVTYDNKDVNNASYYKADRTATIRIKDRNFRPGEVNFVVTAKDVQEKESDTYAYSQLTDWSDWHQTKDEDYTWEATVPFDEDANYDISLGYTDLAGHSLEEDYSQSFTVDKTAPDTDKMTVSYSTPLKERILNAITFGYYKESVEVTIKAEDLTSGIDYLTWTYVKETGASNNNVAEKTEVISRDALEFTEDGKTATSHFTLKATETEQYRGSISFTATDMAGNISNQKSDNERINVVDNISPTRVVSYSTAKQVVDATTLKTKSSYQYDSENTNSILYYDGDVKVTLRVTEANFYAEDVNVYVNGVRTNPAIWNQVGTTDEWMSGIILSGDGDYWVTMDYTDRSTNEMKTYQSEKIVIDTINPVVSVDYANTNVRKNVGDHKYFNDVQKATIQIKEHNFRADDVVAKVTAKNVSGENVKVPDYAAYLSDRSNWQKNGDVYTAHITYNSDANYTFDIDYKDLALRKAADYKEDFFTVDKTAPTNLNVSYSEGVAGQTLGNVPYHYYNQMITVTISGEDETAGIEHFVYSYRNASGVSKVNAELLEAAIERAKITQHGNKFTATFTIPKSVLQSNNQFNGTVEFTAYDFSTNQKDLKDGSRLVVDNIAPTGSVTFNDPVQEVNGISYYSGNIEATIVINEANFYAEDVQISVEKDGGAGTSVSANWTDNSADIHTGTFTLSDDGDYIVTVNYTDRSSNKMETYTSRQLTIDTQHPTIHVSNIKVNSANKDEKYEFTITATDTADNLPVDEVKPLLKEVTRSEIGTYETKDVPLENITTEVNNQTYSIKVENLEEDGVYTLSCTAKDWANNEYNKFTLDDGQEYENVTFSVNRNGSTFLIDNNTEKMLDKYYVYSVENPVVIKEINTDPIEKYVVKLNGTELEAGEDYITENVNNEGEWNERTYTINKKLFEGEGEYSIVVESTDKAETASYSDIKGLDVSWIVDQTAPVVAVSGLENSGRYKTESQTVTAIPTDDGGKLKSFKAVVADKSGTVKKNNELEGKVLVDLSGEELDTYLGENDGKITFNIPEGLEEQVQIICTDYAVHEDGKTTNEYNEVFSRVTVSANSVIIFYANKPLFYGTIIGIVLTAGGIFLIVWKRKKKKAEGTYKK